MEDITTHKISIRESQNLEVRGGLTLASNEGTTHSVRLEEQIAFSRWINKHLGHDPDLKSLLPIAENGESLYERVNDGIILCKLINHSVPTTIDERVINTKELTIYSKLENLTLAINSARSIGCYIVNIDSKDLLDGNPHLVLGLLWQIIRIGLFNQINPTHCPGLARLIGEGSNLKELAKLSSETILIQWVNYHLKQAKSGLKLTNFGSDIKDSEIYTHLLHQIAPRDAGVTKDALLESDPIQRAEMMLRQADKLGCRQFISAEDVTNGFEKLNLAFVANLFSAHSALDTISSETSPYSGETREEKTYKNWMNSLGISPRVNFLYSDLRDGLVIFQLYDIIRPQLVKWFRVTTEFSKLRKVFEVLENCNYAVELGRKLDFSLVGISGENISTGNPTLTLALVWQLMRCYTLSILTRLKRGVDTGSPITEKEILLWANKMLMRRGKLSTIRSFQDQNLRNGRIVLDLIDSVSPGAIDYSFVKKGDTPEESFANANYAVSVARRIGATVYALPEDISEVQPRMIMTIFACLMTRSEELDKQK